MGDVKLSNDKENEFHHKNILHFGILNYQNTNHRFWKLIQIHHNA